MTERGVEALPEAARTGGAPRLLLPCLGTCPNEIRSVGYRGRRPESFSSQSLSVCTRRTERRIPVFNEGPLEPAAAWIPLRRNAIVHGQRGVLTDR